MTEANSHRPPGYPAVCPYLTVSGAAALLEFLGSVYEAEVIECHRESERIVHAAVRIDDSVIEVSEATDPWPATPAGLHIYVADTDAAYERATAAGAESLYAPTDMPYGERSAGVRDAFGNQWYLATYAGKV